MAKRTRARTADRSMFRMVGQGANVMLDSAVNGIFDSIGNRAELMMSRVRTESELLMQRARDQAELVMNRVEDRAMDFRARFVQRMFASVLIGVGVMVLLGALLAAMVEYFDLSWALSLLIVGVIMIAAAFIVQLNADRRKHGRARN